MLKTISSLSLDHVHGGAQPKGQSAEAVGQRRVNEQRRRANPVVETGKNFATGFAQGMVTGRGNPWAAAGTAIVNTFLPPKPAL